MNGGTKRSVVDQKKKRADRRSKGSYIYPRNRQNLLLPPRLPRKSTAKDEPKVPGTWPHQSEPFGVYTWAYVKPLKGLVRDGFHKGRGHGFDMYLPLEVEWSWIRSMGSNSRCT